MAPFLGPRSEPNGVRTLVVAPGDGAAAASDRYIAWETIWRSTAACAAERLRDGEAIGVGTLTAERGDAVLARVEDGPPLWVRRGLEDRAALVPRELETGEGLRDAFVDGRFLALLPLVHLFREVEPEPRWRLPPLRASFVFDDPNLRRPSYGFVRFPELARHAERHGYHATMATIPLDGRGASRRAAEFFRGRDAPLSLVVHGNDHLSRELGRSVSDSQALAIAAQAWRRIESLERRVDLPVARIMVPPHGALSEAVARALLRTGYDGACVSRPYPWLEHPPADRPLAGWDPAEIVVGGLPLLPRFRSEEPRRPRAEGVSRPAAGAVRTQRGPRRGLRPPRRDRGRHRRGGDVPLGLTRRDRADELRLAPGGRVLRVRLFTRRARIELPPGATSARLRATGRGRRARADRDRAITPARPPSGEPIDVAGATRPRRQPDPARRRDAGVGSGLPAAPARGP